MKKYFFGGLLGISFIEFLNAYFIMPFPGSQELESIELAYFFHQWKWVFRTVFLCFTLYGIKAMVHFRSNWFSLIPLLLTIVIIYFFNFKMKADKMFIQPDQLKMKTRTENKLDGHRLVIGVANGEDAKAYPIEFLAYHHQVLDSLESKSIMVTYCSVCRTGRVFEPLVKGKFDKFRLVGMDHYNAMFEDELTGSWWRQVNGEAVAGPLKGEKLPEVKSMQLTVDMWFELFPKGKVMQEDPLFKLNYDSLARYEQGKSKGKLTRRDSLSWNKKSWIIGIENDSRSKAYDWNDLKKKKIIHDTLGNTSIVIILASDENSFVAFERNAGEIYAVRNDTIYTSEHFYDFSGRSLSFPSKQIKQVKAYQEYWHSWLQFHPKTLKYNW